MEKNPEESELPSRPTASDVARLAGVSRTQVSYVLNNNRLAHVSEENRRKILAAAEALEYQPHASAQTLRRGYSKEFSIFFPAPYTPRINRVIGSIHEAGLVQGFTPIQYSFNSYGDEKRKFESLHSMLNKKPFGVFCSLLDLTRAEIDYMKEKGVKKILVWDIEEHEDLTTLYLPIKEVGETAGEYFSRRGYGHAAILKPRDPVQHRAFELRMQGFLQGWKSSPPPRLDILDWPDGVYRPTMESAQVFVDTMIRRGDLPRAIYAFSDDYALPLLAALRDRGIAVPGQLAVLGTDNNIYSEMTNPRLSTIQLDTEEMGHRAVALMNHLISGDPLDPRFDRQPRPLLVERESG